MYLALTNSKYISFYSFSVFNACDATELCCKSGIQGDKKCKSNCVSQFQINDGRADCLHGSDEGTTGNFLLSPA